MEAKEILVSSDVDSVVTELVSSLCVEALAAGPTLLLPGQRLEETSGARQTGSREQTESRLGTAGAQQRVCGPKLLQSGKHSKKITN